MDTKQFKFKDSKFLSAKEKQKILSQWKTFITKGPEQHLFTKTLYEHLHQNCCFIAHFDMSGFYHTYFVDPQTTMQFFQQFDKDRDYQSIEYGMGYWRDGDMRDINVAMCEVFEWVKKEIYEDLRVQILKKHRDAIVSASKAYKAALNNTS